MSTQIGCLLTEFVAPGSAALSATSQAEVVAPGCVSLRAGQTISFSGWLDALPLGYWGHFTTVETARLEVTSSAPVDVTVRVSDAQAICRDVASGATCEGSFTSTVDVRQSTDGGWAWAVIKTEVAAEVSWRWVTDDIEPHPDSLAVAITTFDRQDACLKQLHALAPASQPGGALDGVLGRIILVDQGTKSVAAGAESCRGKVSCKRCKKGSFIWMFPRKRNGSTRGLGVLRWDS